MDNIIDLKGKFACPFMACAVPGQLAGQVGIVSSPCLEDKCAIYNNKLKKCSLNNEDQAGGDPE